MKRKRKLKKKIKNLVICESELKMNYYNLNIITIKKINIIKKKFVKIIIKLFIFCIYIVFSTIIDIFIIF